MNLRRCFDVFAHQRGENVLGGDGVFEAHFQQRARFGVHRGGPELLGIHFAQALEARDGEFFLRVFENVIQQLRARFPWWSCRHCARW